MPTQTQQGLDPQKVLAYIKRSGTLVAEAEKQAASQLAKDEAVSTLIPTVVDALINNGRIPEELREKAAASLKDHAKTLEVLASVAAQKLEDHGHLGNGYGEKKASASPYVGAYHTEERESDSLLLNRMGIR